MPSFWAFGPCPNMIPSGRRRSPRHQRSWKGVTAMAFGFLPAAIKCFFGIRSWPLGIVQNLGKRFWQLCGPLENAWRPRRPVHGCDDALPKPCKRCRSFWQRRLWPPSASEGWPKHCWSIRKDFAKFPIPLIRTFSGGPPRGRPSTDGSSLWAGGRRGKKTGRFSAPPCKFF